jgi:probable rRNA maturation factor
MTPKLKPLAGTILGDIQIRSPAWKAEPAAKPTVRAALTAIAATITIQNLELCIVLTDDKEIRALNRQWRGIDKPTNVLSFPAACTAASIGSNNFRGDIVMAYEALRRECDDEGWNFLHHLAHLTIHGFLHNMGYGHNVDAEAEEMEGLESKIMTRMGLPDPWLGRHLEYETGNA